MSLFNLGLIFGLIACFSFHAFGSAVTNMMKLNIKNNFANLSIGAFLYFSLIVLFLIPILLLQNIPYFVLIYYFLILNIAYLTTVVVFVKFWFQSIKISWETFILIVLFLLTVLFFFMTREKSNSSDLNNKLNYVINSFKKKDNDIINFFVGENPKTKVQNFPIWNVLLAIPFFFEDILSSSNEKTNLLPYVESFSAVFNACILFSIFCLIYPLVNINSYKSFNVLAIFIWWIITMCFFVFALRIHHPQIDSQNIIKYFLVFWLTIFITYVNENYRMKSMPLLIGMVIPSYIAFDWDQTFQLLFLFYAMIFIIQIRYFNIFVKDFSKMAFFIFFPVLFYCIKQQLFIQIVVVSSLIIITLLFVIRINTNYHTINIFEGYINRNISFFILIVPLIMVSIGLFYFIKKDDDFYDPVFVEHFFAYKALFFLKHHSLLRSDLTLSLSLVEFVFAVCYFFKRKSLTNNFLTFSIDLFLIQFITFYNGFSFIIVFKSYKSIDIIYDELLYKLTFWYVGFILLIYSMKWAERIILSRYPLSDEIEVIRIKSTREKFEDTVNEWKNWTKNRTIKTKNKQMK